VDKSDSEALARLLLKSNNMVDNNSLSSNKLFSNSLANASLSDLSTAPAKQASAYFDDGASVSESIEWPNAVADNALIPEDWSETPTEQIKLAEPKIPAASQQVPPDTQAFADDADYWGQGEQASPVDDISIKQHHSSSQHSPAAHSPPEHSPPGHLPPEHSPAAHSPPGHLPPGHLPPGQVQQAPAPVAPVAVSSQGTNSQSTTTNGRQVIDAMGLADYSLDQQQVAQINEAVGAAMRESIVGLMQVLRSRASIKNEFRMNVTTIQPVENNPLKFSANLDDALENMFIKKSNAYQQPVDAIAEGFQSIADHQIALLAGIRSAFQAVIESFSPEKLEQQFEKQRKFSLMPILDHSRNWEAYKEHHHDLSDNMETTLQHLFGDEFVKAYEDQLRQLSHSRAKL
ncbi:MAG: type VI secretion system-associated FHA domain protein TagH, partial [Pseudomonadota bacterium]